MTSRVALVTGGTGGIGTAIVKRLADMGHKVATNYRNEDKARAWQEQLKAAGYDVAIVKGDVTSPQEAEAMVREVEAKLGPIDILVNNAGITKDKVITKMTDADWYDVINVNLSGSFFLAQEALKHMIERGTGRIVNVSSLIGEHGNIGQANYAASKSGEFGLTKTLAKEACFHLERAGKLEGNTIGITVNTVTPGYVMTEMVAAIPQKVLDKIAGGIPVRRIGSPAEIARVVHFLCADESGYITGQIWGVNGGQDM